MSSETNPGWELTWADAGSVDLDVFLDEGWEPFGVVAESRRWRTGYDEGAEWVTVVYLRRPKAEPEAVEPEPVLVAAEPFDNHIQRHRAERDRTGPESRTGGNDVG